MQSRRPARGRLGDFLIERGLIRPEDLERALEIQRVAGGHLGTNLLELGVVDEEPLLEAIGHLHEHPTVDGGRLHEVPDNVSALIPADLIRRHSIVPFELHGNTVYVASQRPGDIHIENEVTLATSRLTRTFMALEVRVQDALHRLHGHALPLRFARLVARLDGGEEPVKGRPPQQAGKPASTAKRFEATLSGADGDSIVRPLFEPESGEFIAPAVASAKEDSGAEIREFPTPSRNRPRAVSSPLRQATGSESGGSSEIHEAREQSVQARPAAHPDDADLRQAHAALLEAPSREAVGRVLMDALRPFFRRRLLLAKRGSQLVGWRADGPGVRPRNLEDLAFEMSDGTPFLAIHNGSSFWLGDYHQDAAHAAIHGVLGSRQAPDCMILPVRAGQHIVAFLYGDNETRTVTGQPLRKFLEFSEAAGKAFERIILRIRQEREAQPAAEPVEATPDSEPDPWAPRKATRS